MVWIQIRTDVLSVLVWVFDPGFETYGRADQRLCYSLIGKYDIKTCSKRNFNILYIKLVPVAEQAGFGMT